MATPVEQIKERLSIVDVVSSYVSLAKAGKNYKAKSPFTNEKTPSFFVSPDRGMYYCFSSGKGGDIFTFIQEMEGVDFKGALKMLAERAGITLVKEDPAARTEREQLYALLEEATGFFVAMRQQKESAVQYLTDRAVTSATIESWRIGYAPDEWRSLKEHLMAKGYSEALIMRAGLAKTSGEGKSTYDVFRNRIMFPISDVSGRVVAFSGRSLSTDPAAPKYVNSPETELYIKSDVLFGYDKAKQGIRTFDFSLIVEGQFDLVLAHQAGYTNAVAISGTALTQHHVELLGRLANKAVLALDADSAGIASVKRAASLMLTRGMDVKVAQVPVGKDPADLVAEDSKLLKSAIGGASHVIEFLISVLKDESKDNRSFRLRVRDEVLPFIAAIPNHIDREYFEGIVAEAIETTRDAIHYEVQRIESAPDAERSVGGEVSKEGVVPVVERPRRGEDIVTHLYGILLWQEGEENPHISVSQLRKDLEKVLGADSMQLLDDQEDATKSSLVFKVETLYTTDENAMKELNQATAEFLNELYTWRLKRELSRTRDALTAAERAGDETEAERLLGVCVDINKQLSEADMRSIFGDQRAA